MFIRTFDNKIQTFDISNFSYKLLWYKMYNVSFVNDDFDKIQKFLNNKVIII